MELVGLLILGIPAFFIIRWLMLRSRFARLEERIGQLELEVQQLRRLQAMPPPLAPAASEAAPEPVIARAAGVAEPPPVYDTPFYVSPEPAPAPVRDRFCVWCGKELPSSGVCACRSEAAQPAVAAAPAPIPAYEPQPKPEPEFEREPVVAGPSLSERLREKLGGEEWEALVGGSLLNKLGVLILVIGIALFLGYSFTQMGPAGRAATGLGVSLAMLGGGIFVERRERYRIFARGLLGGGWAALYFTTYAIHAVEATRVIESPLLGGLLLFAVAAGMIAHSLRYRSQTLSGLAYFVAFVTLAITPATTLSVVALIPLAASLLFLAYRFEWTGMAVFGLLATWGTIISRGDSGAPAWQAQLIFTIYWLLFECFDLLRASKRTPYRNFESLILPVNALAFAGLTWLKWSKADPERVYLIAAAVAGAYAASAMLRARVRPPSSFAAEEGTIQRILWGGYEGPVTIAAALSAFAVLEHFRGGWASLGLLAEAETLFLAGLWFGERYLRQLAAALFGVHFVKLFIVDLAAPRTITLGNWTIQSWTPASALSAVLFYLNRYLQKTALGYGYAGSAVVALILGFETPELYVGLAWFTFAAALYTFGWLQRLPDFRYQAYAAAVLGAGGTAVRQVEVANGLKPPVAHPWIGLSISALLCYNAVLSALRSAPDRLGEQERHWLRAAASWSVTALIAAIAWRVLPEQYLGLGWMILALPVLELGLRALPSEFRMQAYALSALGAAAVLFTNIIPIRNDGPLALRMIPACAALAGYLFATRLFAAKESVQAMTLFSAFAGLFGCAGLWALLPPAAAAPAWAALALLLVEAGIAFELPGIASQGHIIAAASFSRLFFANFTTTGSAGFITHRLATVTPVAAAFYHLWSRLGERRAARYYLHAASILVFVLLRFELGRTLTVTGWAAFAVLLLVLGRRWNVADLRWQSYVVAAAAFVRSLTTDFNAPGSLSGPAGRIAAGAFVIACLYAMQLLVPLADSARTGIERFARLYFSLLATALTTILLFHEVSGSVLTVAWGLESIALLTAGFPLRDRTLRLSGLSLFLLCILKLFFYDLRNLDTAYRILSFIVLGLMLLAVSWVYTRFRERIARYL